MYTGSHGYFSLCWCIAFISVPAVGDELISEIGRGLCVLLGISREDSPREAEWM